MAHKLLGIEKVNFDPVTDREKIALALYHLQEYTEGCRCWGIDSYVLPEAYASLKRLAKAKGIK